MPRSNINETASEIAIRLVLCAVSMTGAPLFFMVNKIDPHPYSMSEILSLMSRFSKNILSASDKENLDSD